MGGTGESTDGRLELDELGGVLDRATDLDRPGATSADVLEGVDGPSWAERLEAAGVTGFLRRHGAVIAGATAVVLLLAGGLTAFIRSRPPVDDGVIAATILDAVGDATVGTADGGTYLFSYRVAPVRPGDSVRLLGITGPGIRASSVDEQGPAPAGDGVIVDVLAVPGCDDPRALSSTTKDFSLLATRTDSFGRTVTGSIPLPSASMGQWPQAMGTACLTRTLAEDVTTESVKVTPHPERRTLDLVLRLHNGIGEAITVGWGYYGVAMRADFSSTYIAARATVPVPISLEVFDCDHPTMETVSLPTDGTQAYGLYMNATLLVASGGGEAPGGPMIARWSAATQREIQGALDTVCAGQPTTSVRLVSSTRGSNPALVDQVASSGGLSGRADLVVLRSRIEVRTTADHVVIGDTLSEQDRLNGGVGSLSTASGDVVSGRVTLTIDWVVACSDFFGPPAVRLDLSSHGAVFPSQTILDDEKLAQAFLTACPGRLRSELTDWGWSPAA